MRSSLQTQIAGPSAGFILSLPCRIVVDTLEARPKALDNHLGARSGHRSTGSEKRLPNSSSQTIPIDAMDKNTVLHQRT